MECIKVFLLVAYVWGNVGSRADKSDHLKFEYQYSFKGPHIIQPDQTVPFWNLLGDVVPGEEQVRLVPSIRDKKGLMWSKYPFPHDAWQIEVHLRIEGRGNVGADGMAIWYTSSTGQQGPVFGSQDNFDGVGIILDSFDNDNRMNNPFIYAVLNDGTKSFDHASDGIDQQSGGCLRNFRNRPYPIKLLIKYHQKQLDIFYSSGNSADEQYVICASLENVNLPPNYYFGVSAATGGLADDHDVLKFLTWSISDKSQEQVNASINQEERQKLQQDYEKNVEDFNKMQEEYREQHPDAFKDELQRSPEQLYEGAASPELKAIFEVQSEVKNEMRQLSVNMQAVLQQQTSVLNAISTIREGVGSQQQHGVPAAGADDAAKKYHIDNVINMQRETYDIIKEIKDSLNTMQNTVINMDYRIQQQGERANAGDSYEGVQQRQEIVQSINNVQNDITALLHRQSPTPKLVCPEPEMPSCVSLGVFVVIAAIQIIVLLAYHITKSSREDAAKKFF